MAGETWTCPSCSATNARTFRQCTACGAPREGAAAGDDGSPGGPPPLPSQGGAFELKRVDCTGCGAAIDLLPVVEGGQVRCASCGSVLDLSDPELRVLAEHVKGPPPAQSAIRVGMECVFHGTRYRVSGRIVYVERNWHWSEWFLVAADGTIRYLEEDGHHFRLLAPFTPKQPPPLPDLERKTMVRIDGRPATVVERGTARLEHFEGQLPWRATPGDEVRYVDLAHGTERLSVEFTKRELEFYRGLSLPHPQVAQAFGLSTLFPSGWRSDDDDDVALSAGNAQLTPAQSCGCLALLLFLFLLMAMSDSCSTSVGGTHGGRSTFGGGK